MLTTSQVDILVDAVPMLLLVFLLFGGFDVVSDLIQKWMSSRERVKLAALKARRAEALARMSEQDRRLIALSDKKLLTENMPDWLDPDDPDDVAAWKRARAEVVPRQRS